MEAKLGAHATMEAKSAQEAVASQQPTVLTVEPSRSLRAFAFDGICGPSPGVAESGPPGLGPETCSAAAEHFTVSGTMELDKFTRTKFNFPGHSCPWGMGGGRGVSPYLASVTLKVLAFV